MVLKIYMGIFNKYSPTTKSAWEAFTLNHLLAVNKTMPEGVSPSLSKRGI